MLFDVVREPLRPDKDPISEFEGTVPPATHSAHRRPQVPPRDKPMTEVLRNSLALQCIPREVNESRWIWPVGRSSAGPVPDSG